MITSFSCSRIPGGVRQEAQRLIDHQGMSRHGWYGPGPGREHDGTAGHNYFAKEAALGSAPVSVLRLHLRHLFFTKSASNSGEEFDSKKQSSGVSRSNNITGLGRFQAAGLGLLRNLV
jgi:hypothetical protein